MPECYRGEGRKNQKTHLAVNPRTVIICITTPTRWLGDQKSTQDSPFSIGRTTRQLVFTKALDSSLRHAPWKLEDLKTRPCSQNLLGTDEHSAHQCVQQLMGSAYESRNRSLSSRSKHDRVKTNLGITFIPTVKPMPCAGLGTE